MLFEQYVMKGASESGQAAKITFVQDFGQHRNLSDGTLQTTGNPFDVAISGDGFSGCRRKTTSCIPATATSASTMRASS